MRKRLFDTGAAFLLLILCLSPAVSCGKTEDPAHTDVSSVIPSGTAEEITTETITTEMITTDTVTTEAITAEEVTAAAITTEEITTEAGTAALTEQSATDPVTAAPDSPETPDNGRFEASYVTDSYTFVGKDIALKSCYHDNNGKTHDVTWSSLTPATATVDAAGNVHPLAPGIAKIRASCGENGYIDFPVTVLDDNISDEMKFVLKNHSSNALTVYNLGIGAGTPEYYYDVVGSTNNLLFSDLTIDRTYYGLSTAPDNNWGPMDRVEFICVHYTGNMGRGADGDNHARYFNSDDCKVSIHYVVGRTNLEEYGGDWSEDNYMAFACLDERYGAKHAGTEGNPCVWDPTGIMAEEGDPDTPVISVSPDGFFTVNGKKSVIKIPNPPKDYTMEGELVRVNGVLYRAINAMGLRTIVADGEYCLCRTWWGRSGYPGKITAQGGNVNSIGIETCVDIGSDLMHTWHVTAQLVAQLLIKYNLDFDRVVGHYFFSGKDCPQPMIENDFQLWHAFMDMVGAEYERLTRFGNVKFTAKAVDGCGILSDSGLLRQNERTNIVTCEITAEKDGRTESITLATAVESSLSYTGPRAEPSLQMQNCEIK